MDELFSDLAARLPDIERRWRGVRLVGGAGITVAKALAKVRAAALDGRWEVGETPTLEALAWHLAGGDHRPALAVHWARRGVGFALQVLQEIAILHPRRQQGSGLAFDRRAVPASLPSDELLRLRAHAAALDGDAAREWLAEAEARRAADQLLDRVLAALSSPMRSEWAAEDAAAWLDAPSDTREAAAGPLLGALRDADLLELVALEILAQRWEQSARPYLGLVADELGPASLPALQALLDGCRHHAYRPAIVDALDRCGAPAAWPLLVREVLEGPRETRDLARERLVGRPESAALIRDAVAELDGQTARRGAAERRRQVERLRETLREQLSGPIERPLSEQLSEWLGDGAPVKKAALLEAALRAGEPGVGTVIEAGLPALLSKVSLRRALLPALAASPQPWARDLLGRLRWCGSKKALREAAAAAAREAAELQGVSPEELTPVPSFDDPSRPGRDRTRERKAFRRNLTRELERAMLHQTGWAARDFEALFTKGEAAALASGLLWGVRAGQAYARVFTFEERPARSGAGASRALTPVHPALLSPAQLQRWTRAAEDMGIEPPFPQLERSIARVGDGQLAATLAHIYELPTRRVTGLVRHGWRLVSVDPTKPRWELLERRFTGGRVQLKLMPALHTRDGSPWRNPDTLRFYVTAWLPRGAADLEGARLSHGHEGAVDPVGYAESVGMLSALLGDPELTVIAPRPDYA